MYWIMVGPRAGIDQFARQYWIAEERLIRLNTGSEAAPSRLQKLGISATSSRIILGPENTVRDIRILSGDPTADELKSRGHVTSFAIMGDSGGPAEIAGHPVAMKVREHASGGTPSYGEPFDQALERFVEEVPDLTVQFRA